MYNIVNHTIKTTYIHAAHLRTPTMSANPGTGPLDAASTTNCQDICSWDISIEQQDWRQNIAVIALHLHHRSYLSFWTTFARNSFVTFQTLNDDTLVLFNINDFGFAWPYLQSFLEVQDVHLHHLCPVWSLLTFSSISISIYNWHTGIPWAPSGPRGPG